MTVDPLLTLAVVRGRDHRQPIADGGPFGRAGAAANFMAIEVDHGGAALRWLR